MVNLVDAGTGALVVLAGIGVVSKVIGLKFGSGNGKSAKVCPLHNGFAESLEEGKEEFKEIRQTLVNHGELLARIDERTKKLTEGRGNGNRGEGL